MPDKIGFETHKDETVTHEWWQRLLNSHYLRYHAIEKHRFRILWEEGIC